MLAHHPHLVGAAIALVLILLFVRVTPAKPHIVDGDTIATTRRRWRLAGYDAPEWTQPGGRDAAKYLQRILGEGRAIGIAVGTDVYGRTLVHLFTRRGPLSWRMVGSGNGHAMTPVTHVIQLWARIRRKGVWGGKEVAIHPDLWRRMHAPRTATPQRPRSIFGRGGRDLIRYERQGLRMPGGFHI